MENIPTFATVGQRLEWWIAKRNRKQTELAKAAGMAQSAVSEIISGRSKRPAADNMLRLARELQLRPEYLVWGEGPPETTSFSQLSGLEAQLVMLFRCLPDDAKRDALLIDVNDFANRHKTKPGPSPADPFPNAARPAIESAQPKAKKASSPTPAKSKSRSVTHD
jgi:transcriptional regulator with XRE-family HTH domain